VSKVSGSIYTFTQFALNLILQQYFKQYFVNWQTPYNNTIVNHKLTCISHFLQYFNLLMHNFKASIFRHLCCFNFSCSWAKSLTFPW